MSDTKKTRHMIWGFILFITGVAMFMLIPERVREIKEAGHYIFGLRFGLYVVSVLLIIGGGQKLYKFTKNPQKNNSDS